MQINKKTNNQIISLIIELDPKWARRVKMLEASTKKDLINLYNELEAKKEEASKTTASRSLGDHRAASDTLWKSRMRAMISYLTNSEIDVNMQNNCFILDVKTFAAIMNSNDYDRDEKSLFYWKGTSYKLDENNNVIEHKTHNETNVNGADHVHNSNLSQYKGDCNKSAQIGAKFQLHGLLISNLYGFKKEDGKFDFIKFGDLGSTIKTLDRMNLFMDKGMSAFYSIKFDYTNSEIDMMCKWTASKLKISNEEAMQQIDDLHAQIDFANSKRRARAAQ